MSRVFCRLFCCKTSLPALTSCAASADVFGYFPITTGSQMFYFGTLNDNATAPLVFWLQGGPGGSGLFGKFLENGPTDVYGNARRQAWTRWASMVWIDNPVGTGFSFVSDNGASFATSDQQIADDLVTFTKQFFTKYPQLQTTPLWIFTERCVCLNGCFVVVLLWFLFFVFCFCIVFVCFSASPFRLSYGGKMTSFFARSLVTAIQSGVVRANFKGVGLGDGWLAPIECMKSYAPYLTALSLITRQQAQVISDMAAQAEYALESGNGKRATDIWGQQQQYIGQACDGCNWYSVTNATDLDEQEAVLNTICSPGGSFYSQVQSVIPSGVTFGAQVNKRSRALVSPHVFV